ncbi:MAG: hypothetical protein AAF682_09240 [Planctomycetota bacterium]
MWRRGARRIFVALLAFFLSACAGERELSYEIDLTEAAAGIATVELRLSAVEDGSLVLHSRAARQLFRLDSPEAFAEDGAGRRRAIAVDERAGTLCLDAAELDGAACVVRYTLRTATYIPPNGEPDRRHFGFVGARGCALPLPLLLMAPDDAESARLSVRLPAGWSGAVLPPELVSLAGEGELWAHAIIAAPGEPTGMQPHGSISLRRLATAPAERLDAATALITDLRALLGPPRLPFELLLTDLADDERNVDVAGPAERAVVDLPGRDLRSLRHLVRALVPRWYGRAPAEVERSESAEDWFLLGLTEYVARALASRHTFADGGGLRGIESSWMLDGGVRRVDLLAPPGAGSDALGARRLAGAAWLHELVHRIGDGGLAALVGGYDGIGLPAPDPHSAAAGVLAAFLAERRADPGSPLHFEPRWRAIADEIEPAPGLSAGVAGQVAVAFSSFTHGAVDDCGCEVAPGGGARRRASELGRLKDDDPLLLALDLGAFLPRDAEGPAAAEAVDPELLPLLVGAELDAMVVGPDEVAWSPEGLRPLAEAGLPLTGAGAVLDGEPAPLPYRMLRYGDVSVGFLGYSERVEEGFRHEAAERRLAHARFASDVDDIEPLLRELRASVDLLVVGGSFSRPSLKRLCEPELGVDLVLVGHASAAVDDATPAAARVGDTWLAVDNAQAIGLSVLTIFLSEDKDILGMEVNAKRLSGPAR